MGDADLRTAADAYIVALDAWRAAMSGDWHDPDLPDRCSAAQGHMDAMERTLRAALSEELAAVGPITDQVNAERALAEAVLEVWGLGDPDPTQTSVAHDMAAALLTGLYARDCRVITPSSRLPAADGGEPEEMARHLWPALDGDGR